MAMMNSWVVRLIAANVLLFLLSSVNPAVTTNLMLVPALVLVRPWTLVTYMFLHASWNHLFFNMLGLVFFGPRLEAWLGGKKFLRLYFVSGLTGALLSFLFSPNAAVVGASGAVYGVLIAFAVLWPREVLYIWGIVPVQARWMVAGMTLLSLLGGGGVFSDGVAHFAHLGGFLGGYLMLRLSGDVKPAAPVSAPDRPAAPSSADLERWMKIPAEKLHEVNREELERIREKIRSAGAASLTPTEREFLERFSAT